MKNSHTHTLKVLGRVLLVSSAVYCTAVRILFNVAFGRNSHFFSSRYGEGTRYEAKIREGRKWMMGHSGQEVTILSSDNLKLKAHYIETPKAKRTVVMVHGWRGEWDYDFAPCAKWFYEHGCNLLAVEMRAQHGSEGRYMTLGLKEQQDVRDWIGWLEDNEHIDMPVYLYGLSMGATSVLMAAGNPLPFYVKGIIADCGFTAPDKMLSWYCAEHLYIPPIAIVPALSLLSRLKLKLSLRSNSTLKALKHCEVPVLFIHGTADKFVPARMTMESYNACRAPKRLLLVKGAPHAMSYLQDTAAYTKAVMSFFRSFH